MDNQPHSNKATLSSPFNSPEKVNEYKKDSTFFYFIIIIMSFYITLISDQSTTGTTHHFTAQLPHLQHLVEDDWEAALVYFSHPTIYNWTQEDSQKNPIKADIGYRTKVGPSITNVVNSHTIYLPPGYYHNLKLTWNRIAYEIEKQRMKVMMSIQEFTGTDQTKDTQTKNGNVARPYVNISDSSTIPYINNLAKTLDSFFISIPYQMDFTMTYDLSRTLGLESINDKNIYPGKNFVLPNIVDDSMDNIVFQVQTSNHKPTHIIFGRHPYWDTNIFAGPQLSLQPFTTPKNQIMICTDLVTQSIVGNTQINLLRLINNDGDTSHHHFNTTELIHIPLRKTIFDTITIDIKTADGIKTFDKHEPVILTLWLSRKSQRDSIKT